ncbi:hypothetical protein X975_23728, partial [Stegodyphus mimosarum]
MDISETKDSPTLTFGLPVASSILQSGSSSRVRRYTNEYHRWPL